MEPYYEPLLYILVDFGCLLFPFLFSFHRRFPFYKEWRFVLLPASLTAAFFLVWDFLFTTWGVWGFNDRYVIGLYAGPIPAEEILFFLCIPYACVFTYFCVKRLFAEKKIGTGRIPNLVLIAFCLICAIVYYDRLYTFSTAMLLAIALLFLVWKRVPFLGRFYLSYVLVIPFFLLSNGILTGAFTNEAVVWYNNAETCGIRLFTIPLEDTFFGMLLILLNVAGYEFMLKRQAKE